MASCVTCKWLYKIGTRCAAFPRWIPAPIQSGEVQHTVSVPGDNGITYADKRRRTARKTDGHPGGD